MDNPASIITCTYFNGDSQCGKPAKKLCNDHPCCNDHVTRFKNDDGTTDIIVPIDSMDTMQPRKLNGGQ